MQPTGQGQVPFVSNTNHPAQPRNNADRNQVIQQQPTYQPENDVVVPLLQVYPHHQLQHFARQRANAIWPLAHLNGPGGRRAEQA